jgi:hypothetical protein
MMSNIIDAIWWGLAICLAIHAIISWRRRE